MSDAFKDLCDLLDKTAYETAYAAPLGSREAEKRAKALYEEGRIVEAQAVILAAIEAVDCSGGYAQPLGENRCRAGRTAGE